METHGIPMFHVTIYYYAMWSRLPTCVSALAPQLEVFPYFAVVDT